MAAPATPVSVNGTQDTALQSTTGAVYGFAVKETAGNAAVFNLRCVSASGQIVIPIRLNPNESARESWPHGILFDRGVYEDWISGAYNGTIFIGSA